VRLAPKTSFVFLAALLQACAAARPPLPLARVDLDRLYGGWYLLATIPNRFERGLVAPYDVYSKRPDGDIQEDFYARRGGFGAPRKHYTVHDWVRPGTGDAHWRVQLFWPINLPFLVLYADPDYRYVLFGRAVDLRRRLPRTARALRGAGLRRVALPPLRAGARADRRSRLLERRDRKARSDRRAGCAVRREPMLRIAIVGAGIGGLAAAVALRDAGHEVEVFERAKALAEADAGLTLWPNGTLALRRLGVLDAVRRRGAALARLHLRRWDGAALMGIPTERFDTDAVGVHRADLFAALLSRLPGGSIHLNSACAVALDASGEATLAGTGRGAFDLVVAADGARSAFRAAVCGVDAPRYAGYTVFRGVVAPARKPLPAGLMTETWGRGLRFGLFPIGAGRWCWYAAVDQSEGALVPAADRAERLRALFADWSGPAAGLVAATPHILQTDAYLLRAAPRWRRGRVLLLGDAAHPMPPNLGQGACMTLEDAALLGELLSGRGETSAALARFEAERRGRTGSIAGRSGRIGALGQWSAPLSAAVRDAAARLIPGRWFTWTSRDIHAHGAESGPARHPRTLAAPA
jgi:2-polyprenyl-6-methoxyphenol hydroxylase-like FAD-dependent oxidoreductase/lipocalin